MITYAPLLVKGDVIKRFGKPQIVVSIDKKYVHVVPIKYCTKKAHNASYTNRIGIKSKERIELVELPPPPKKEEKIKRAKGEYSNTTPFGIKI